MISLLVVGFVADSSPASRPASCRCLPWSWWREPRHGTGLTAVALRRRGGRPGGELQLHHPPRHHRAQRPSGSPGPAARRGPRGPRVSASACSYGDREDPRAPFLRLHAPQPATCGADSSWAWAWRGLRPLRRPHPRRHPVIGATNHLSFRRPAAHASPSRAGAGIPFCFICSPSRWPGTLSSIASGRCATGRGDANRRRSRPPPHDPRHRAQISPTGCSRRPRVHQRAPEQRGGRQVRAEPAPEPHPGGSASL